MRSAGLVLVVVAAAVLVGMAHAKIAVDPNTNMFVDESGRSVFFHGLNVVNKEAIETLTSRQISLMRRWGFNVVRLGFLWSQFETAPDSFDDNYLNGIETLVNTLGRFGIYSFLDMHQDLWGKQYCGGHGFPEWYAFPPNTTQYRKNGKLAYPEPLAAPEYGPDDDYSRDFGIISNCGAASGTKLGWAGNYLTFAIGAAAQRMYDNADGVLDKFGAFWQRAAERFKDNNNVLAYELINEPWVGDLGHNIHLAVPGVADRVNLQHTYEALHKAIREVDNSTIIFYEPATGGNVMDSLPVGFPHGPGGDAYNDRQALSYHIYCPLLQTDVPGNHTNPERLLAMCKLFNGWQLGYRKRDVKRLHTAGILSEFGAIDPNDPSSLELLDFMTNSADDMMHSWTYWYLTPNTTGANPEAKNLVRTFARRVAGTPTAMQFDPASGNFSLSFLTTEELMKEQTEIYISKLFYYNNGYTVAVSPAGAATWEENVALSVLEVTLSQELAAGTMVTLTIAPTPVSDDESMLVANH